MAEVLDGTVVLVTAPRMRSAQPAMALAARGATVALAARRKDRLDALAANIQQRLRTALDRYTAGAALGFGVDHECSICT